MTALSARASSASEAHLSLGGRDIHLWLCRRAAVASSDQFKREVLSRYAPVAPPDWQFVAGDNGKLYLLDPPRPLAFNLSGSADWLACAVTCGTPVGVDLEYCEPRRDVLKLARRFFRAPELAALQGCSGAERTDRFYDYWTLKEAQIKSRGGSIARDLATTGFGLALPAGDNTGPAVITADPADAGAFSYCCLLDPVAGYRLALSCHSALWFSPCLRIFEQFGGGDFRENSTRLRAVGVAGQVMP